MVFHLAPDDVPVQSAMTLSRVDLISLLHAWCRPRHYADHHFPPLTIISVSMTSRCPPSLPLSPSGLSSMPFVDQGLTSWIPCDQLFTWERIAHHCVMARDSDAMTRGLHVIEPCADDIAAALCQTADLEQGPSTFHMEPV
jgi:hypothetical protein